MINQVVLLAFIPALASAQLCIPYFDTCVFDAPSDPNSASWLQVMSCTANQVPKLPEDFSMPLYQYIFEVLAKNTHLLPLGVPIKSESEDFETTLAYEKCLWGTQDMNDNAIDGDSMAAETKVEETAYNQLFESRQGGFDSLTGFSLLGGKVVAALIGYIVYTLTN